MRLRDGAGRRANTLSKMEGIVEKVTETYTYYGRDVVEATVTANGDEEAFIAHLRIDEQDVCRWAFTHREDAEEFAFLFVQE